MSCCAWTSSFSSTQHLQQQQSISRSDVALSSAAPTFWWGICYFSDWSTLVSLSVLILLHFFSFFLFLMVSITSITLKNIPVICCNFNNYNNSGSGGCFLIEESVLCGLNCNALWMVSKTRNVSQFTKRSYPSHLKWVTCSDEAPSSDHPTQVTVYLPNTTHLQINVSFYL